MNEVLGVVGVVGLILGVAWVSTCFVGTAIRGVVQDPFGPLGPPEPEWETYPGITPGEVRWQARSVITAEEARAGGITDRRER